MDAFVRDAHGVGMARALNRLRDQAQVAGLRKVSEVYGIGPRTTEKYVSIDLASPDTLEASINAKGAGFPLYALQPRQTRAGVSVRIKGRRVTVPHAFIATMKSGHIGVFARGAYGGRGRDIRASGTFGRFTFGKRRLPINELYSFGPAEAMSNPDVVAAMEDRVDEQAAKVIESEIRFAKS